MKMIDLGLIWACIENEIENGMEIMDWYENTWKWKKMSGNEKTELKLHEIAKEVYTKR